jgi:hypothetical protein
VIVHLLGLAGLGYRVAAERLRTPEARGDIVTATLQGAVLVLAWIAVTHTVHREPFGPATTKKLLNWGEVMPVSDFIWYSLLALNAALVVLTLTWRRVLRRGYWTPASGILALSCLAVLLWRHGQQLTTNVDRYVYNPAVRVDFHAPSPAIAFVQADATEPVRTVGLDNNLFPGWSGAYGIESTGGPDAVVSQFYRELIDGAGLERTWDWAVIPRVANLARERRVYDFLNVRYYLDLRQGPERIGPWLERRFEGDLDVYVSPGTWPRAFYTDRVAIYEKAEDLGGLIHDQGDRPFAAMQSSDWPDVPDLSRDLATRTSTGASEYVLTNNTTSFSVEAPRPGLVVLHENWFRDDIRVTLNGTPTRALRVNHSFRGVHLPEAGTYRVTFAYWPQRFTVSLWLAASGGVLLALLLWWGWRRDATA